MRGALVGFGRVRDRVEPVRAEAAGCAWWFLPVLSEDVPSVAVWERCALARPVPCRFCGEPAWGADQDGPLHLCCAFWRAQLAAGHACSACGDLSCSEVCLSQFRDVGSGADWWGRSTFRPDPYGRLTRPGAVREGYGAMTYLRGLRLLACAAAVAGVVVVAPSAALADSGTPTPPSTATPADASSAPDEATAGAIAQAYGHQVEVSSLDTGSTTTYVQPSGGMSEDLSSTPVRVARNGGWVPTDLSLVQQADGSFAPVAAPVSVSVGGAGSRQLATFTSAGGGSVSYGWNAPLPAPQISGSTARYVDVAPGVDLVAQVTYTGVETSVVFKTAAAAAAGPVDLPLTTSGLTAQLGSTHSVSYVDGAGATVARTPAPRSWDTRLGGTVLAPGGGPVPVVPSTITTATGAVLSSAGPGAGTTTSASGSLTDELSVPAALLNDPGTSYPIVLDPGVACSNCGEGHHGYVENDGYNEIDNMGWDYGDVHVGTFDGGSTVTRGLFQFAQGTSHGTTITDAKLQLTEVDSWSTTAYPVTVYQSGGFDTSATWPGPSVTGTNAVTGSYAFGHDVNGGVNMTVTGMVQAMASTAGASSYYFQFRVGTNGNWGPAEADSNYWKEFAATETLHVDFDRPPGQPAGRSISGCWVQCAPLSPVITKDNTPTLTAQTSDPDGDKLTYYYYIYKGFITDSSGLSPLTVFWQPGVVSGVQSQAAPTYVLPDGDYSYTVRAYDGLLYGPWANGFAHFTVDHTHPPAPTLTSSSFDLSNNTVTGHENVPGTVTIHPNGGKDIYEYAYSYAGGVPTNPPPCNTTVGAVTSVCSLAADGSATISIDPTGLTNTIFVDSFDKAGNVSTGQGQATFTVSVTPAGQPDHAWIDRNSEAGSGTVADWSGAVPAMPLSLANNVTWNSPVSNGSDYPPPYQTLTFPAAADSTGKLGAWTTGAPLTVSAQHSVTVAAWVYASAPGSRQVAVSVDGSYNSQLMLYQNENGQWQFCMPTTQTAWNWDCASTPNGAVTQNAWTMLVGVWDAGNQQLRLYVNGDITTVYTASHTTLPAPTSGALWLGHSRGIGQANYYLWNGSIADPIVYNEVLGNDEIHHLAAGLPNSLQGA